MLMSKDPIYFSREKKMMQYGRLCMRLIFTPLENSVFSFSFFLFFLAVFNTAVKFFP